MWYKVIMVADDEDEAIVFLTESEYKAVQKFLTQIKEQWSKYGWVGGHWFISPPCATRDEAINVRFDYED